MPKLQMQVEIERLPLKSPFRISGYTFTEIPVAVVTLRSGALVGRGEAAGVYYLEDTPDRIAATLEKHRAEIESGVDRQQLLELLPRGGARNAVGARPAAVLVLVHAAVGDSQQRLLGLPILGKDRDAEADAELDDLALRQVEQRRAHANRPVPFHATARREGRELFERGEVLGTTVRIAAVVHRINANKDVGAVKHLRPG